MFFESSSASPSRRCAQCRTRCWRAARRTLPTTRGCLTDAWSRQRTSGRSFSLMSASSMVKCPLRRRSGRFTLVRFQLKNFFFSLFFSLVRMTNFFANVMLFKWLQIYSCNDVERFSYQWRIRHSSHLPARGGGRGRGRRCGRRRRAPLRGATPHHTVRNRHTSADAQHGTCTCRYLIFYSCLFSNTKPTCFIYLSTRSVIY